MNFITPLFAMMPGGAANGGAGPSPFSMLLPILGMLLIFYFLMIRPQQKRMREHQAQIAAVKKGDEVITGGGLRGRVTKVTDDEAEVEIANGVRVRAIKSTLSQVLTNSAKPAND